jgi:hypothetical protein
MLTKIEARELVEKSLAQMDEPDDPFVVDEEWTMEKSFGWVFFYNSKKFVETGEFRFRLAGNGPVTINKFAGAVEFHGSRSVLEGVTADCEKKGA